MAKQVTMFAANDGRTFPTAREAWEHDLYCYFDTIIQNECVARRVVTAIKADPQMVASMVEGMFANMPAPIVLRALPRA